MQSLKKYYFGKQKAKVNTYIGGIGGTINTPALLASRLGINVSRIKLFKVTGVDIECAIVGGSYALEQDVFNGNNDITFYNDTTGLVSEIKLRAFQINTSNNFKWVYFPNCLRVANAAFYCANSGFPNIEKIIIPRCNILGDNAGNNFVFGNQYRGFINKVYLSDFLRTNNGGLPDGDLTSGVHSIQNIRYVTNFTPPNAITNLSAGQIYNTAIQLNFTPPSSTNAIDFYEVYVNNSPIPQGEITASGQFITGLTPNTNYNITVVAVDIFYNKSVVSNAVNVSTSNGRVTDLSVGTIYNTVVFFNFSTGVYNPTSYKWYDDGVLIATTVDKKLTGLTPNTAYTNITVRPVDPVYGEMADSNAVNVSTSNTILDVDASAYMTTSNNGDWQPQINNLFTSLKSNNLYNKIQAFYLFLGTTQAQHKWNAKNPQDTNAAFRLQFFGGGTHSNLGYQCNGTDAYANTFLVPSVVQNINSNGLTLVCGTNNNVIPIDAWEVGAYISNERCSLLTSKNNNTTFSRQAGLNNTTYAAQSGINDSRGIFTATKTTSNLHKLIRNQIIIATSNGGGTLPTNNIFIGTISVNASPNSSYSSQRIQFLAIHEGLTDAEVQTLHTIIDAFEAAIGRKTW